MSKAYVEAARAALAEHTREKAAIAIAQSNWWSALCRRGDPSRRPNLTSEAFEAGWIEAQAHFTAIFESERDDLERRRKRLADALEALVNSCEGVHPSDIPPRFVTMAHAALDQSPWGDNAYCETNAAMSGHPTNT